jgi:photosystem II stability/assembly factor-like uncharacterized protein
MVSRFLLLAILMTFAIRPSALLAGWERTSGPGGGVVNAIATYNITGFPYIFAGTRVAGIFRSESNGDAWSASGAGIGAVTISCFLVSENLVLAGTKCGGVYRSLDSGRTWQHSALDGHTEVCIDDLARAGSFTYALTEYGVYRSNDEGVNWLHVDSSLVAGRTCIAVDPFNSSILYVGVFGHGVYCSTDNGATWVERRAGLGDYGIDALTFFGTTLIAGTYSHGVYRSTNGGLTWQSWDFAQPLPFDGSITSLVATSSRVFAGTSGSRVFVQSLGVDGWLQCSDSLTARVNTLCVKGSQLLAGTHQRGIFRVDIPDDVSAPFANWTRINTGLAADFTTDLHEVGFHFANYHYLLAGSSFDGVFVSADSGASWTQQDPGLHGTEISAVGAKASTLIAGASSKGLYRSVNGATTWDLVDSIKSVTDVCVSGPNIVVCSALGKVLVSSDDGVSWASGGTELPPANGLRDLAVSGGTIYIGTSDQGLYKSTDYGINWQPVPSPPGSAQVSSIAVNGADLFVATGSGVFLSSDGGANWSQADWGIEQPVNGLFNSTSGIFAFTPSGVLVTHNRGFNWTQANEGLEYTDVYAMAEFSGSVYAAVYESGVWKRRLSEMSYMPGDADGNMVFTISDAVYLINYIFSGGAAPSPVLAGDANCSKLVTISDAVYLINYIFSGGPQPGSACK